MAATSSKAKQETEQAVKTVEKDIKPAQKFFTKFNNDWVFNHSGALAYSLLMSIFPIAIAILSIFGFFFGSLGTQAQSQFITGLTHVLPSQSGISSAVVRQIFTQLHKNVGVFAVIAVALSLFSGSRLFVQLEGFLDMIYHVRQRAPLKQNGMAFLMLLLFVILIPIMTAAAVAPTFIFTLLKSTPVGQVPGIATIVSIVGGLLAAFIFFWVIYIVVPNQHISLSNSWLGALVAAVALQLYLTLFPLYVTHFLNTYAGPISLVILLVFFYYFAVILMLGAEVNAYFLEKVRVTPTDPVTMMYLMTSQLPKSGSEKQEQAAQGYKDKPISDEAQKAGLVNVPAADTRDVHEIQARKPSGDDGQASSPSPQNGHIQHAQQINADQHQHVKKHEQTKPAPSKTAIVAEAVAGTGLAFLFETWRMRQRKPKS
jgi:YihY family inner membrane protein